MPTPVQEGDGTVDEEELVALDENSILEVELELVWKLDNDNVDWLELELISLDEGLAALDEDSTLEIELELAERLAFEDDDCLELVSWAIELEIVCCPG